MKVAARIKRPITKREFDVYIDKIVDMMNENGYESKREGDTITDGKTFRIKVDSENVTYDILDGVDLMKNRAIKAQVESEISNVVDVIKQDTANVVW